MSGLWFTGICDELYLKIVMWNAAYWTGEVHSTRQFLNEKGVVIDKPVKCAHRIPFRQQELDHLVRIASQLRANTLILDELKQLQAMWKHGHAIKGNIYKHSYWKKVLLPNGLHRSITLAFYPEHAKDIMNLLTEAKTDKQAANIDSAVADKKSQGKDLFEQ